MIICGGEGIVVAKNNLDMKLDASPQSGRIPLNHLSTGKLHNTLFAKVISFQPARKTAKGDHSHVRGWSARNIITFSQIGW